MKKIISHAYKKYQPNVPNLIVPDIQANHHDVLIAKRILAAYQHASVEFVKDSQNGIWAYIKKNQKFFLNLLDQNNSEKLAGYLCNITTVSTF